MKIREPWFLVWVETSVGIETFRETVCGSTPWVVRRVTRERYEDHHGNPYPYSGRVGEVGGNDTGRRGSPRTPGSLHRDGREVGGGEETGRRVGEGSGRGVTGFRKLSDGRRTGRTRTRHPVTSVLREGLLCGELVHGDGPGCLGTCDRIV